MLRFEILGFGMFGFKSKKGDVLNHWLGFVDGFSFPPQEFYAALEKQLHVRQVPGLEVSRVEWSEGGLLSDKRLYLRLLRERLAFDTCAAPFGTTYFFSCRTVDIPAAVRLWHLLAVLLFLGAVNSILMRFLGLYYSLIATAALVVAIAQVFRNATTVAFYDLDTLLIRTPALGPIYERWFRKETYYRTDTRLVYLELVPRLFRELAEETVGAKGAKFSRQYQWAPVLGELYKPLPPAAKADAG
jgi:hypothetical protein